MALNEVVGVEKLRLLLRLHLLNHLVPFIEGPSGIGKTAIVYNLIQEINDGKTPFAKEFRRRNRMSSSDKLKLVVLNASVHDESDLAMRVFIPGENTIRQIISNDIPTENAVIFIDEITNAVPDFQKFLLPFIAEGRIENTEFRNIHFITAGNAISDSELANTLSRPLLRRLVKIAWRGPTVAEWIEEYPNWIRSDLSRKKRHLGEQEIQEEVNFYASNPPYDLFLFLQNQPSYFLQEEDTPGTKVGTPRQWSEVARFLVDLENRNSVSLVFTDRLDMSFSEAKELVIRSTLIGLVGEAATTAFLRFINESKYKLLPEEYIKRGYPEVSPMEESYMRMILASRLSREFTEVDTAKIEEILRGSELTAEKIAQIDNIFQEKVPSFLQFVQIVVNGKLSNRILFASTIRRFVSSVSPEHANTFNLILGKLIAANGFLGKETSLPEPYKSFSEIIANASRKVQKFLSEINQVEI